VNQYDLSYNFDSKKDNNIIGIDKRRLTFDFNDNCDINITKIDDNNSGLTAQDAPPKCNINLCNNKKKSLQSTRTNYNTNNLTECNLCDNEEWIAPPCELNLEIAKQKAQNYYNTQGEYKGQYSIKPYYINKINDTQFDMSYVYTKNDNTDIGIDKRRFTFNFNNSNCDINITNMGAYLSGNTVQDAPPQCNNYLCNNIKQQIKNNNQTLRSGNLSECNYCPVENWDPPTCNYGACENVKNIYKSRNWAYDTANFSECSYCPRDIWSYSAPPPPPQNSCNYGACRNVIQSYINNGWWYTSSNFGECNACPIVSYPNNI
jgi:hypothetical protein